MASRELIEGVRERIVEGVGETIAGGAFERNLPRMRLPLSPANGVTVLLTNFATDANLPIIGAGRSSVARICATIECE